MALTAAYAVSPYASFNGPVGEVKGKCGPVTHAPDIVSPVWGLTVVEVFAMLSSWHELKNNRSTTACRRISMKVIRIYTGADNQTHFQDLDVETFAPLAAKVGEGAVRLNQGPAKSFSDFHNAPRRQYVVITSGMMEVEIADGTKRQFVPGDVLVAEDLTGKGHITRGIGEEPRVSLAVPLGE
jgi:hypothetical protein